MAIVTTTFYARGDSGSANNAALNAQGTNTTPVTVLEFQAAAGAAISFWKITVVPQIRIPLCWLMASK